MKYSSKIPIILSLRWLVKFNSGLDHAISNPKSLLLQIKRILLFIQQSRIRIIYQIVLRPCEPDLKQHCGARRKKFSL